MKNSLSSMILNLMATNSKIISKIQKIKEEVCRWKLLKQVKKLWLIPMLTVRSTRKMWKWLKVCKLRFKIWKFTFLIERMIILRLWKSRASSITRRFKKESCNTKIWNKSTLRNFRNSKISIWTQLNKCKMSMLKYWRKETINISLNSNSWTNRRPKENLSTLVKPEQIKKCMILNFKSLMLKWERN